MYKIEIKNIFMLQVLLQVTLKIRAIYCVTKTFNLYNQLRIQNLVHG